jgi:hypothetical protein
MGVLRWNILSTSLFWIISSFVGVNSFCKGADIMSEFVLTEEEIKESNQFYSEKLKNISDENLKGIEYVRNQIKHVFQITLVLYIALFILGISLLSVPLFAAFNGNISIYNSIIGGTLGITDIAIVLAFKPVERIHDLMGDMSQISMAINSYQQQVALRIIQFDSKDRTSIDHAAEEINRATRETLEMIQTYVEGEYKPKDKPEK